VERIGRQVLIRSERGLSNCMSVLPRVYRLLFARPGFRRLNTALYTAALRGLGVLNYENANVSGERYLIRRYLPTNISNPRPVFFDVGANVGEVTAELADVFPRATIHAFEPHPQNYARLSSSFRAKAQVRCHNVALGTTRGQIELHDRADRDGSTHASLHAGVISDIHGQAIKSVAVTVDTLDDVAHENEVGRIDYLKIDTEGNELAILEGASRMLQEHRLGYIHFEFNEMNIISKASMRDFRKLLRGHDLFRLLPRGLLPLGASMLMTEIYAYQNILAVPNGR
jgi:FkbM family methyltransferase